jgi:hypothetical protein
MVAITVDLKTKGLALRPGASLQCRAFMKFRGPKALNDKLPVMRLTRQVKLNRWRNYFRVALNPSRVDAKRGDYFPKPTYRYRSREDVLESLRSSETLFSLLPELSSSQVSRKPSG